MQSPYNRVASQSSISRSRAISAPVLPSPPFHSSQAYNFAPARSVSLSPTGLPYSCPGISSAIVPPSHLGSSLQSRRYARRRRTLGSGVDRTHIRHAAFRPKAATLDADCSLLPFANPWPIEGSMQHSSLSLVEREPSTYASGDVDPEQATIEQDTRYQTRAHSPKKEVAQVF